MQNPHVALVFPDDASAHHWQSERVFKRAGLELKNFRALTIDNALGELSRGEFTVALVFGERTLQHICQKEDILRWHNRVLSLQLVNRTILAVICIEPNKLLARRGDGTGDGNLRNPPRYTGAVIWTIRKTCNDTGDLSRFGPVQDDSAEAFDLDPTPVDFRHWCEGFYRQAELVKSTILHWDIETDYKMKEDNEEEWDEEKRKNDDKIIRMSFYYKGGRACSVPYLPEYMDTIRQLLAYEGDHGGWNFIDFDRPLIERDGHQIGGRMLDFMDGWKLWQTDLDKGIEFVSSFASRQLPWKHLGAGEPARYSAIDSLVCGQNSEFILAQLEKAGLLKRFYIEMGLKAILVDAGERGNHIDEAFRKRKLVEFEAMFLERLKQAQELVPEVFLKRRVYTRKPKDAGDDWHEVTIDKKVKVCSSCGKEGVSVKHKCPNGSEWQKSEATVKKVAFYRKPDISGYSLDEMNKHLSANGFNPASAHQMKAYMKFHHHPVGTNHKTKKDSADTKHLTTLLRPYGAKHPIYAHTLDLKKIQKALGYCYGLEPDEYGKCHTTYVNSTSTWRLGSRNINVQQLGKRASNKYAKSMRAAIIPSPGCVLVQADSSAVEQVMVGYYMNDPAYIKLARMGIHAHLTCKWLKIPSTPENRRLVKDKHHDVYERIKNNVHGISFGMGPWLMAKDYPDLFPTVKDAIVIQDFIFREVPGLKAWQHTIRVNAQKSGYVDNPWGLRHYFYDVFTYEHDDDGNLILDEQGNPKVKKGHDHNRAIAFKPQSGNAMFMRDNLILMGESKWREYMPAIVSIHDGYTLDVPEALADEAAKFLEDLLTRPITEMGGLRVGCEIEMSGPNRGYKDGVLDSGNFLDLKMVKVVEIED
jgi:hypothetical protein